MQKEQILGMFVLLAVTAAVILGAGAVKSYAQIRLQTPAE